MLHIVIIDDDKASILVLIKLLKKLSSFEIHISGTALNLDDGVMLIKKAHPDIVFLDIQLAGRNGLEIFNEFTYPHFKIIICTAYQQYALDALNNATSGFLLKPVGLIELQETLQKISKELKHEQLQHLLEEHCNFLYTPGIPSKNIFFDLEDGFIMLNTRNMEYCYAHNSYCGVVTYSGKKYIITKSLSELEDILPKNQFYRTHNSYLVNIYYIRKYVHSKESYVLMKSGIKIPVSVRITSDITEDIKNRLKQ
jgi:two-component system LytT family response regulator